MNLKHDRLWHLINYRHRHFLRGLYGMFPYDDMQCAQVFRDLNWDVAYLMTQTKDFDEELFGLNAALFRLLGEFCLPITDIQDVHPKHRTPNIVRLWKEFKLHSNKLSTVYKQLKHLVSASTAKEICLDLRCRLVFVDDAFFVSSDFDSSDSQRDYRSPWVPYVPPWDIERCYGLLHNGERKPTNYSEFGRDIYTYRRNWLERESPNLDKQDLLEDWWEREDDAETTNTI